MDWVTFIGRAIVYPLAFLLVFVFPAFLNRLAERTGLIQISAENGRTIRGTSTAVSAIVLLGATGFILFWIFKYGRHDANTLGASLLGAILAIFSLLFMTFSFDTWRWNFDGISFMSLHGNKRILWREMAKFEILPHGRRKITDIDGRTISWGKFVISPQAIDEATKRARPDLTSSINSASGTGIISDT